MKNRSNNSVYDQMQRMAELTIAMVLAGKLQRAKKFINAAEKLFLSGNYQSRTAVSNVYLYDISTILELHRYNLQLLLPPNLQREYIKQINSF